MNGPARLAGSAVARSELLLRARKRADNVMETLDHVPGSAVRGHLASRWIGAGRAVDERFKRVFLSGDVEFRHAYPEVGGLAALPAPLSLGACKSHGLADGHTVADVLGSSDLRLCKNPTHATPGGPLRRVRGYIATDGKADAWHVEPGSLLVSRQRIGTLQDGTGRAADGHLFQENLIRRGTRFRLEIHGPRELLDDLAELLGPGPALLEVGRSRTILGHLAWEWEWDDAPAPGGKAVDEGPHALLFASDTILLDQLGRNVVDVSTPRALAAHVLDVAEDQVTVHDAVSRTTVVGGWDALHGIPKPHDEAIAAGSVVLASAPVEAWERLRDSGAIGWRRSEGFGRVELDPPVREATSWQTLATEAAPDQGVVHDPRREELAERATGLAAEMDRLGLSRSAWQGLEQIWRMGDQPAPLDDGERRRQDQHPQSRSGAGADAGRTGRERRNKAVEIVTEAMTEAALTPEERATLADDIGKELDLLRLERTRRSR